MGLKDFQKRYEQIMHGHGGVDEIKERIDAGCRESERVYNVVKNTPAILDDLDEAFQKQTKLTPMDMSFLFIAVGLQIARQYVLTKFPERLDDQAAAKGTRGHGEEHSDRSHRYYNPSLEEILTNPVPFDANIGANGALSGGGFMGHRTTAIGHDPILGIIFGTANIATATLTTSSMQSYHIGTLNNRDAFTHHAQTPLVLGYTGHKLLKEGLDGKIKVGASLGKEIIHLKSDLNTKHSLPFPVVSVIDKRMASTLASYGLDMANIVTVGKQATYAALINAMISMTHRMFYDGISRSDEKLYEVRTRKILSYSNLIASSSNLAVVAVTQDFKNLDLGGLAVTIYRLVTDRKFIQQVKYDFIFGTYKDMILNENGEY